MWFIGQHLLMRARNNCLTMDHPMNKKSERWTDWEMKIIIVVNIGIQVEAFMYWVNTGFTCAGGFVLYCIVVCWNIHECEFIQSCSTDCCWGASVAQQVEHLARQHCGRGSTLKWYCSDTAAFSAKKRSYVQSGLFLRKRKLQSGLIYSSYSYVHMQEE